MSSANQKTVYAPPSSSSAALKFVVVTSAHWPGWTAVATSESGEACTGAAASEHRTIRVRFKLDCLAVILGRLYGAKSRFSDPGIVGSRTGRGERSAQTGRRFAVLPGDFTPRMSKTPRAAVKRPHLACGQGVSTAEGVWPARQMTNPRRRENTPARCSPEELFQALCSAIAARRRI